MNFLDSLVIPQSSEHIQLLQYLLVLLSFLFIPYIGLVIGGTFLSIIFRAKAQSSEDDNFLFSKEVIRFLTINNSAAMVLGIFPLITSTLIYAQLLNKTAAPTISYLFYSILFIFFGFIFILTYKNIITGNNQKKSSVFLFGWPGLIILLIGVWFYFCAVVSAANPEVWGDSEFYEYLLNATVLLKLFNFLTIAFALTGSAVLFVYFYWEGGRKNLSEKYSIKIKSTGIKLSFFFTLLMPLFIIINILQLPPFSITGSLFLYSAIALILLLISYHFLFAMIRDKNTQYSGHIFYFVLLAVMILLVKDQIAMDNSTKLQTAKLSLEFETSMNKLLEERGVVKAEINGEEIFKVRCAACHTFDTRLVGPPYKETLPKYEGKQDQLIAFILNPVKINPAYPPMPNPALKPDEAKAVAEYIMSTYKK